ncbi:MAG TPA: hypothetical protein VFB45_00530 [Pseudolabrys sp.]|nr:hypothetical protein [Pseudolabrys sp.]
MKKGLFKAGDGILRTKAHAALRGVACAGAEKSTCRLIGGSQSCLLFDFLLRAPELKAVLLDGAFDAVA